MTEQFAIQEIRRELARATSQHPRWPRDIVHAAAIVGEEAGELQQSALQATYEGGDSRAVMTEAVHTAAMALRLLLNLDRSRRRPSG